MFAVGVIYGTATFVDAGGTWGTLGEDCGSSNCAHGWLAKLNSAGLIEWAVLVTESQPGTLKGAKAYGVSLDAFGTAYVAGLFYDCARFGEHKLSSKSVCDTVLARVDTHGRVETAWTVASGAQKQCGYDVAVADDGSCVVVGQFDSHLTFNDASSNLSAQGKEGFLVKKSTNQYRDSNIDRIPSELSTGSPTFLQAWISNKDISSTVTTQCPPAEFVMVKGPLPTLSPTRIPDKTETEIAIVAGLLAGLAGFFAISLIISKWGRNGVLLKGGMHTKVAVLSKRDNETEPHAPETQYIPKWRNFSSE